MLGQNTVIFTAAVALAVSFPASAGAQQDLRNPDNRDSIPAPVIQDLRNPDSRNPEPGTVRQDLRSPDAVDAGRHVGIYAVDPVATAGSSDARFQWGDAGIGAAAMLGLISLAGASAMIAGTLRRRRLQAPAG